MSVHVFRAFVLHIPRRWVFRGSAVLALICCIGLAAAQVELPEVVVRATKPKPPPKPAVAMHAPAAARVRAAPAQTAPQPTPAEQLAARTTTLNQGLNTIYAPTGTAPTTISHNTIEALPQGENATVEKIVLQFPGATQDSAASGSYHVRNEHANVQVRINGIMLPDGVSGFGTFLDTALIGNMSLITGALPPQFGLRTSGVLDIWTRNDAFNNTGRIGVYGGSRGTFTPSIEYGGTAGQTQYFVTGRFFESDIGLENPTANLAPYAQFNVGIAREFLLPDDPKPMTLRFDVVNLFDTIYFIRDGSGIGVFAPQYGPRRGYFAGLSKKF